MMAMRTKDALAAKKAQGVSLGGTNAGTVRTPAEAKQRAETLRTDFEALSGMSARSTAAELNKRKAVTPSGRPWSAVTVIRVRQRLAADRPLRPQRSALNSVKFNKHR
jgi:hypothetical protein